jgi:glyceraldehyde-3-phosphate dehydrogenase type II
MKVLVNGVGNIGTTILNVLALYKRELGISAIYANKSTVQAWNTPELGFLRDIGIVLCSPVKRVGFLDFTKVVNEVDYIFDTGANGSGLKNKNFYQSLKTLRGCCAQGSEKDFGIPFMSGINNDQVKGRKFVQVVSCNTHGTAALLNLFGGKKLGKLVQADMVVVRRSEDIGNHQRLVAANVVAKHLNPEAGTHHAIDVRDLFSTLKIKCNVSSSDVTTPSQMMHAVRFNIKLKKTLTRSKIDDLISTAPFLATTEKFDSNVIFESGRRYGFNGRIYSHAILVHNNLLITENAIKGWAFVPQEGNSILSSIHAFLLQVNAKNQDKIMRKIQSGLLRKNW